MALAVLVVVLALGAVVAIVASSADGEKTRASPSTPANIPVAPPVTTVAPTTTVAIAAGPTAADLMPLVLADSDVPFSWQEATDKENDDDSTTDADKVSGETPECTAALRQYVTPSAEKALVKVKTVFARTGSHGGPSVKTVAEADSLAKATSDFAAEMATYERCPTVIYDGTRITYTPIPGLPVVGDEILGYKVVAITASGGQAKGLEYVARSGSKAWTFEYNANVNDYVDSEANMLYTKALAKWTAGIK
ncbi:MAG: hypothetical protein JWN03_7139 [Nocardia sp.]|nr:hypothetical protein [Nocardia sp.]